MVTVMLADLLVRYVCDHCDWIAASLKIHVIAASLSSAVDAWPSG
jgi:hypothetical protein